jgi:hypothetical protein
MGPDQGFFEQCIQYIEPTIHGTLKVLKNIGVKGLIIYVMQQNPRYLEQMKKSIKSTVRGPQKFGPRTSTGDLGLATFTHYGSKICI